MTADISPLGKNHGGKKPQTVRYMFEVDLNLTGLLYKIGVTKIWRIEYASAHEETFNRKGVCVCFMKAGWLMFLPGGPWLVSTLDVILGGGAGQPQDGVQVHPYAEGEGPILPHGSQVFFGQEA